MYGIGLKEVWRVYLVPAYKTAPSLLTLLTGIESIACGAARPDRRRVPTMSQSLSWWICRWGAAGMRGRRDQCGEDHGDAKYDVETVMLAAETAFVALHPGARFMLTASSNTFTFTLQDQFPAASESNSESDSIRSLATYNHAFQPTITPSPPLPHTPIPTLRTMSDLRSIRGDGGGVADVGADTMLDGRVP
ncbi:hypothetical protein MSAN_02352300 [Mycena sanguinolenta]|uniref:Uncharacterized protein n=1 Tax=Mycena sanguinolenta TaxID=230812 RepID=A0A8H6X623_9AGAR|nr:hypothetical protein MSAN_02352300 [Mycena sanguinolenta]